VPDPALLGGDLRGRRSLDLVFGLLLTSGVTVGVYSLWALGDWIHPQGEGAMGIIGVGVFSFIPSVLAWLAGGAHSFMAGTWHGGSS